MPLKGALGWRGLGSAEVFRRPGPVSVVSDILLYAGRPYRLLDVNLASLVNFHFSLIDFHISLSHGFNNLLGGP